MHHFKQTGSSKKHSRLAPSESEPMKIYTATTTAAPTPTTPQQEIIRKRQNICRRAMLPFGARRKSLIFGFVLTTLALLVLPPMPEQRHTAEAAPRLKALAKTLIFQQLTQAKHFVPLPVPIPVPIEINEKPIYLKGKPKYVNIYKPKPTAPPAAKATTVYNMPIYSPTYEYMSMDPMSSMYSSPMVYANPYAYHSPIASSYKSAAASSDATDSASAAGSSAAHSSVDYDDDTGNYYVRKGPGRKSKLSASDYAYDFDLHRNDDQTDQHQAAMRQREHDSAQQDLAMSGSNTEEEDVEAPPMPNDDESYDHEGDVPQHRSKRQVYYESGYDGNTNCEGFPLEINVRSRIKLDQIFPIHGKSQIKKCVKFKKTLLPPPAHEGY